MTKINIYLVLSVMAIGFQSMAQGDYLKTDSKALFGEVVLSKGFDALSKNIDIQTAISVDVQGLNFCVGCKGFLGSVAVVDLKWSGETDQLRIHFEPEKFGTEVSLAVYTPTNQWLYADNMELGQEGPYLYLYGYDSGSYKIFVGGKNVKDTISGQLVITESYIPDESIRESDVGLDVGFVPTPKSKVDTMLDLAHIQPGDYLIDLGCGDGRIVIEAVKRGAFAHGIDLDPLRIEECWENAKTADVLDKVSFEEANIFDVDLSQASVVSTYLLDKINEALIPKFLKELRPGTRIVSYSFRMGDWEPDKTLGEDCHKIYLWTVPANIGGEWSFKVNDRNYQMKIVQKYQEIELSVTENGELLTVQEQVLNGTRIGFTVSHPTNGNKYAFNGLVEGNLITGNVRVHNVEGMSTISWNATR